jgi:hypothetical protein
MKKSFAIACFSLCSALGLLQIVGAGTRGGSDKPEGTGVVTFSKDIAPIFYKHCTECHRSGGIAPMSLVTYEQARPWARSIREKVIDRTMPPFQAAGPLGYYQEDPRLTSEEVETVSAWVEKGAVRGNPSDLPPSPPPVVDEGFGKPDLVLKPRQPYVLKANQSDVYEVFVFDQLFPEDLWLRGIIIRPGNRKIVHHATLYALPEELEVTPDGRLKNVDNFLLKGAEAIDTWVPGVRQELEAKGHASVLPKGKRFGLQVHYGPSNQDATDQTCVEFYFAEGLIEKQTYSIHGISSAIEIPPGEPNYQKLRRTRFPVDATVLGFHVHMHLRGKSYTIRFIYPDGREEKVFEVPRYDFNWQRYYPLAKPFLVPKDTIAEFLATWDNSSANRFNPDPSQTVHFGEKTSDEMMAGSVLFEKPGENLKVWVKNGRRLSSNESADAKRLR